MAGVVVVVVEEEEGKWGCEGGKHLREEGRWRVEDWSAATTFLC